MSEHMTARAFTSAATAVAAPGDIFNAALSIEQMRARQQELQAANETLVNTADEAGRALEDAEIDTINANKAEIDKLGRQISARECVQPAGAGRRTAPEPQNRADPGTDPRRITQPGVRDTQRHNFVSLGEFVLATRMHALGKHDNDPVRKLMNAATTYSSEGSGADGGFLVPPDWSRTIWQKVDAEENLMNRCAQLTPSGNSMQLPKDETTPWGTAGIRIYWRGEAVAATPSKPTFELDTIRLHELTALVPASDELLEDAPGYESFIMAKVPGILAATINDKIVDGTGAGMPKGILKAESLVTVSKETSQPADTVWFTNINKMWSRMYAPWRRNSVWLINQDIEPSLHGMAFQATGASSMLPGTSAVPAYLPMNGLSSSPYATLMGRPVIPIQACKTVGDLGDIILVDLLQYWALRKASGPKVDTSIHLYFDQALTTFRFIFRMNGQPIWSSAITPQNGNNTLSWAVALQAR